MFAKIFTTSSFVLALAVQVYGHAAVAPALGVNGGTPNRGDVKAPSNNNPCGNNVDIAAAIDSSESVPIKDGSITVSSINFNGGGDGSRQVSAKLDATGKGDAFDTDLTVTKNGDPAPNQEKGEDSVVVTIPADTKCTGGKDGNKCLVQFKTTAGFGNCVVVQQEAAAAAGGDANAGNANAGAGGNADTGGANADTGAGAGANDPAGAANNGANEAENAGAGAGADSKGKETATAAGATDDNKTATGANADNTGAAADANAANANEPATGNANTNSTATTTPDGNANANADPPAAAGNNGGTVDDSTAVGAAAGAAAGAGVTNAAANNGGNGNGNGKKKAKKNKKKNGKGSRPAGTRAARAVLAGIDIRNYEEPEVLRRSWSWAKDLN